MRTPLEHLSFVLEGITPLPLVELPLASTNGLVLGENVAARWPLPSFANSAMDGYAVRSIDVAQATPDRPVELRVIEDIPAGSWPKEQLIPGTAARIMTGAPVPAGADGIVRVEHTDGGMPIVVVSSPAGNDIRQIGEDIAEGQQVLSAGTVMGPRTIGLAAAAGRGSLHVHSRPHVFLLSTGSELVQPGHALQPGQISDVNGVMLETALAGLDVSVSRSNIVNDDPNVMSAALMAAAQSADLIVTTGGVSMGAYDTVKSVLSSMGTVTFERVAMQPGMPQGSGRVAGTPIVTLPGNPVSAFVSMEVFVRPVIRRLQGHEVDWKTSGSLRIAESFRSPLGKVQFVRAQIDKVRDAARPIGVQGSHILGGLALADCLLIVPAETEEVLAGDTLEFLDLRRDSR